jgi:hypothetical protein
LHHHEHVPSDDDDDDTFGDRRALKVEVGRLRRELAARDTRIARLEAAVRHLELQTRKRWWQR